MFTYVILLCLLWINLSCSCFLYVLSLHIKQFVVCKEIFWSIHCELPKTFSKESYMLAYNFLHKAGYKHPSKSAKMSIYGGTIFATSNEYKRHGIIVPRVNSACKIGKPGYKALQLPFVTELAKLAEKCMLQYLEKNDRELLEKVCFFRKIAPQELLVCGSIFNGMALVGDLSDGYNHIHKDKNDLCSIILMVGDNITGGNTLYYKEKVPLMDSDIQHSESFCHGKFQVGPFNKIYHAGEAWRGPRGIISFYINRQMYDHFKKYGTNIYHN